MPIEGSLREFALPDIFQLVHLSRKSGELRIVREPSGTRGVVLFDSGAVVKAGVDESTPRLGYMLLNAGKITEADLHRADQLHSDHPDRSWWDIFTSLDCVEPDDLERFVKFQVEECVYEILDWQDGRFTFGERTIDEVEAVAWIPVESILMEGARRADELSALGAALDSPGAVPRLCEGAANEGGILDLAPEEWEVLAQIDGASDVKSIAWTLGRSEFDVSKVVSRLAEKCLIEIGPAREPVAARSEHELTLDQAEQLVRDGDFVRARAKVETALKAQPEEPRAHFLAARIRENEGDLEGAEQGYARTLTLDPLAEGARERLGLVRLKLGNLEGAAREWTAYLRMTSDGAIRRRVEEALTSLRDLQKAVRDLDDAERP